MNTVLCVKVGKTYSSKDVNRLYRMLYRHTTQSWNMICYTDDPTGIQEGIDVVPQQSDPGLSGVWNKLKLFDETLFPVNGRYVFLDLDVIIQQNVDCIFSEPVDNLGLVRVNWRLPFEPPDCNSSIMIWETSQQHIWNTFNIKRRMYVKFYPSVNVRVDGFLFFEGIEYQLLPENWCYSLRNIADNCKADIENMLPSYKFCMLNGVPHHEKQLIYKEPAIQHLVN